MLARNAPLRPRGHIPGGFRQLTVTQSVVDAALSASMAAVDKISSSQAVADAVLVASVSTVTAAVRHLSSAQAVSDASLVASISTVTGTVRHLSSAQAVADASLVAVANSISATGSLSTSFQLTGSLTNVSAPFAIGHVFKQGEVPATAIAVGNSNAQVTVKNTWPDGSAKFAIIAGTASLTAGIATTITLTSGVASSGTTLTTADLKAAMTQPVTVSAGAFGSVSWTGTDWDSPFVTWVAGHRMSSWIYRKPVGTDAHLVAWLEVRLWSTGAVEVLPWIENGFARASGCTQKTATYSFALDGTTRYSGTIDLLNHQRTPLVSGTALSHWIGSDPGVVSKHDAQYLMSTELVPAYFASVSPSAAAVTSQPSTFSPLQQGSLPAVMGSTGYDPSIGLLPEWDVLYLTSSASSVWAALQRNAYSAGRYGIHWRDDTTNRPIRFSSYATTVMGGGSGVAGVGTSSTSTYLPDGTGTSPPNYAISHSPSFGYMAYLITGRWYFMEQVQFQATANFLKSSTDPRENASGVMQTWSANQTRGAAWGLRTLLHAACITPDSDSVLRTEFLSSVEANFNRQHATYVAQANNPYGLMEPFEDFTGVGDSIYYSQMWMEDFFTAAVGFGMCLGLGISEAARTKMAEFFAWKARSIVGRFGGVGTTEYLYRDAAVYTLSYAPSDTPDWRTGAGPWYASWGAIWTDTEAANAHGTKVLGDGSLRGTIDITSYWGNLQPALAYAVRHGVANAAAAYATMTAAVNWPTIATGASTAPTWAVAPLSSVMAWPAWRSSMAAWEWKELASATINTVTPTANPGGSYAGRIYAWNGITSIDGKATMAGVGGHADYAGNEGYWLDLYKPGPQWRILNQPTPAGQATAESAYYADGRPTSAHTYYTLHADRLRKRQMRFGVGSSWGPTSSQFATVDGYNYHKFDWDSAATYPSIPQNPGIQKAQAQDQKTGNVYVIGTTNLYRWNRDSATWTNLGAIPGSANDFYATASLFDHVRNRFVLVGRGFNWGSGQVTIYDAAAGTWNTSTVMTGAGAAAATAVENAAWYHEASDRYLVKTATGGEVISINPVNWVATALTTTNGSGVPNAGLGGDGVVLQKWTWIPELKAFGYQPSANTSFWVLAAS